MKIIFIDIDGTLIDSNGNVPDSAAEAIKEARKNGHLVFINTGRSRSQVFKYIEDIGFDGFVCSDGTYVEYKGEILKKESLLRNQIDIINNYIEKNDFGFMAEGHNLFLINRKFKQQLSEMIGENGFERFSLLFPFSGIVEKVPYENIGKVNIPVKENCTAKVQKEIGDVLEAGYFSSGYADSGMIFLCNPGSNKINGIDFLLQLPEFKNAETYSFGDTSGDLKMIKGCTHGIAMGNGEDILKQNAEYVAPSNNENGICEAFKKFGLI